MQVFEEDTVIVPVFIGKLRPRELTCTNQCTVMNKVRQVSFRILILP